MYYLDSISSWVTGIAYFFTAQACCLFIKGPTFPPITDFFLFYFFYVYFFYSPAYNLQGLMKSNVVVKKAR
jgi:hypothetical protein